MKKLSLLAVVMAVMVSGALAQNEVKPEKYENVTWHRIVLIDYKAGQDSRAREIIEMYEAAGKAAGLQSPERHWLSTGEYDMMLIWTMNGGPSDMEWRRSADNVKWWSEFVKQQGSEEAATKIRREYSELISSSTSYISRKEK